MTDDFLSENNHNYCTDYDRNNNEITKNNWKIFHTWKRNFTPAAQHDLLYEILNTFFLIYIAIILFHVLSKLFYFLQFSCKHFWLKQTSCKLGPLKFAVFFPGLGQNRDQLSTLYHYTMKPRGTKEQTSRHPAATLHCLMGRIKVGLCRVTKSWKTVDWNVWPCLTAAYWHGTPKDKVWITLAGTSKLSPITNIINPDYLICLFFDYKNLTNYSEIMPPTLFVTGRMYT